MAERGRVLEQLSPRQLLVEYPESTWTSLFALHRFPVTLATSVADLELSTLRSIIWGGLALDELQGRRYGIQISSTKRLPWSFGELIHLWRSDLGFPESDYAPRTPEVVLSVYLDDSKEKPRVWAGVSDVGTNLSPWAGGECRIPSDDARLSRAEAKLLEAWEAFDLSALRGGRALDLGAAPGGWSRLLAGKGFEVHAVDPAPLDIRLEGLGIHSYPMTAQEFLRRNVVHYDLMTCDMKIDALQAAQLLVRAARWLGDHGRILTTFKLAKGIRGFEQAREALACLEEGYQILAARELYFNRSEITVYAALRPAF